MITSLTKQDISTTISGDLLVSVLSSGQSLVTTLGIPGPQGAKGDAGDAIVTQTHDAGENLSGHRAIRVSSGLAYLCNGSESAQAGRCIGISTGAVIVGDAVTVQTVGVMTEPSWSWSEGPVYVGVSGVLTQSLTGLAYIHQIGMALSATSIDINSQLPILIS